jgi:hypothetical protein
MPLYSAVRQSITPDTTKDNWTLHAASGEYGVLLAVSCSGEASSSTVMSTRFARPSSVGTTITTGNAERHGLGTAVSQTIDFATNWTTQPTLPSAQSLLPSGSWNALGGLLYWRAASADEEIQLFGAASAAAEISCRNTVGTGVSTYAVAWRE